MEAQLRAAQARAAAKAPGAPAPVPPATGDELIPGLPRPFSSTDAPFGHIEKPSARPFPTGTPQDAPEAVPEKPEPLPTDKPDKPATTGFVPSPPDSNTALNPPMRLGHILDGNINAAGNAVGFHLRPGGKDPASARMTKLIERRNKFRVYTGNVEVKVPKTGRFITKKLPSSFFPDSFTDKQVPEAIDTAFRNSGLTTDGRFTGDSGRGFEVRGWYSKKRGITTAHPIWKDK